MHILFLSDNFPPETNAPASRTYEHAKIWAKQGIKVTIITCAPNFPNGKVYEGYSNNWYSKETKEGIDVVRVKTFITSNSGFFLRSIDFISFMVSGSIAAIFVKKPDIIVATSPQFFSAIAGYIVSIIKKKPFVFEVRDIWPATLEAIGLNKLPFIIGLFEKIEIFLYHRSSMIITVTNAFKKNLIRRGINSDKIKVIYNGIISEDYSKKFKTNNLFRKKFNLNKKFIVAYIGTHGLSQSMETIIDCAEILDKKKKNIAIVLVGNGEQKEYIRIEINKRRLTNVYSFPSQPKKTMPELWSMCDVSLIVLKKRKIFSQVIPSKIFESMASALPIIISVPKGEATQIISDSKSGIVCDAENPSQIASAILKMHSDNELRSKFSKNSHYASLNFNRNKNALTMLKYLKDLLS